MKDICKLNEHTYYTVRNGKKTKELQQNICNYTVI